MTFRKHYTVEEARALLPKVRRWLDKIEELRKEFALIESRMEELRKSADDLGGPTVNQWLRKLADIHDVLVKFREADIQVKDLERGLIDFPAIREGKEIFLCWEKGEDDIEFWHDLDSGYAGRERL